MVASRIRVMGAYYPARLWLGACCLALMPTSIGYQDLAALLARGHDGGAGWHMIASPFGTVEAATFNYTRPIGSAVPEPLGLFQNVNFDPRSLDAYSWKIDEPLSAPPPRQVEYPSVNRAKKGDRLPTSVPAPDAASLPQLQPIGAPGAAPAVTSPPVMPPLDKSDQRADSPGGAAADATASHAPGLWMEALGESVAAPASDFRAETAADDTAIADKPPALPMPGEISEADPSLDELALLDDDAGDQSTQIYFGGGAMGTRSSLERWAPGAEPIVAPPNGAGIKLSALEGGDAEAGAGDIVAGKDNSRLESPADRLALSGKPRAQAEKCLADAVYFEARGEELKGQEAVAQVVMNRVFSGYYPHDVCGVVYQNADRHLACQFTFACEGKDLSRIDEPDMWEQAKRIAKDTLDGKIWLAEVGHATHYHAYWVHPSWVHEMARLYKLGVHTFYRPLNWGDGGDEPVWGKAAAPDTSKADLPADKTSQNSDAGQKAPDAAIKVPQAAATPEPVSRAEATAKL